MKEINRMKSLSYAGLSDEKNAKYMYLKKLISLIRFIVSDSTKLAANA